jgi:hypothetical protein
MAKNFAQISILIYEKKIVEGWSLYISHEIFIKDGKVLAHFGRRLKVLPESLTDLST